MTERSAPTTQRPAANTVHSTTRVLILASDDAVADIARQLVADDIEVILAHKAPVAAARLHGEQASAVLLCPELGDVVGAGYRALEELREIGAISRECPAIAFSGRAEPLDRLRALQRGCVDFLALPLFYPELAARLAIAIERGKPRHAVVRVAGGLEINRTAGIVRQHGQHVYLSVKEFDLLCHLAGDPLKIFTKHELLRAVWGYESAISTRTLDSHACRIRQKLRAAGGAGYVHNLWGKGYRLQATPEL